MNDLNNLLSKEIKIPKGLLGFEDLVDYKLEAVDEDGVFYIMQSTSSEEISLAVTNPFLIKEDYEIELYDSLIDRLAITKPEDVIILTTVTVNSEDNITSNLAAPIIINIKNNVGEQIILSDDKYKIKEKVFKE